MKVKELIELLEKQDPDKEVLIQQGEEYDYMTVNSVSERELIYMDSWVDVDAVVIQYV